MGAEANIAHPYFVKSYVYAICFGGCGVIFIAGMREVTSVAGEQRKRNEERVKLLLAEAAKYTPWAELHQRATDMAAGKSSLNLLLSTWDEVKAAYSYDWLIAYELAQALIYRRDEAEQFVPDVDEMKREIAAQFERILRGEAVQKSPRGDIAIKVSYDAKMTIKDTILDLLHPELSPRTKLLLA